MRTEPMTLDKLLAIQGRVVMNLSAVEAILHRTQTTLSMLAAVDDVGALPSPERLELDAFLQAMLRFSEALLHVCADEYANDADDADEEERPAPQRRPTHGSQRSARRPPRKRRRNQRAAVVSLVLSTAKSTDTEENEGVK